jgi:hypothetical protein
MPVLNVVSRILPAPFVGQLTRFCGLAHVKILEQKVKARWGTAIVFCLIERVLELLKDSGATLEQSIAALQSVQAILPVADFQSRRHKIIRSR